MGTLSQYGVFEMQISWPRISLAGWLRRPCKEDNYVQRCNESPHGVLTVHTDKTEMF